jgi:hypothetical protein
MKVGILTFHLGANYGAYLQAYCLADTIRQLGHAVEIINYQNILHHASDRLKPWVYRRPWKLWHDFQKHRTFRRAHADLPLSKFTTNPDQVDWNAYDAIVIGSDIVWNCQLAHLGQDPAYFGQFPVACRGRLIAYAPSVGPMSPDYTVPDRVAEGLRRFHFIGARDVNTQRFVENQTGSIPPLVLDPTWLMDRAERAPRPCPRRIRQEFLLVYSFQLEGRAADAIKAFARDQGLLTVAVGYWQGWCDRNLADVDPFEWVQLFKQAKYILSGTFHGTLYAIREQRPFCLLANEGSDSKVSTALSLAGLQDRHTADPADIGKILLLPVDYDAVKARLDEQRRQSLFLLKQALT